SLSSTPSLTPALSTLSLHDALPIFRLFEVGTVFRKGTGAGGGAPEEWTSVAGVLTGARRPPHWSEGAKLPDMDIWDLKYHFELADRKSTRLNSSHDQISYAVFCLKK